MADGTGHKLLVAGNIWALGSGVIGVLIGFVGSYAAFGSKVDDLQRRVVALEDRPVVSAPLPRDVVAETCAGLAQKASSEDLMIRTNAETAMNSLGCHHIR